MASHKAAVWIPNKAINAWRVASRKQTADAFGNYAFDLERIFGYQNCLPSTALIHLTRSRFSTLYEANEPKTPKGS